MNDEVLIKLGDHLNTKIDDFQSERQCHRSDAELCRRLRSFADIELEIERISATTIEGLVVKARLARWRAGGSLTPATVDARVASSIINDILNLRVARDSPSDAHARRSHARVAR